MNRVSKWAKFFALPLELLSLRNLLAIHFFINSIGLIVFSMLVAGTLAKFAMPSGNVYGSLYQWAKPVSSVGKLTSLLQYILPVVALFVHYTIFLRVSKYFSNAGTPIDKDRLRRIGFYFLVATVINGILLFVSKEQKLLLGIMSILWVFLFLWTLFAVFRNRQLSLSIPNWAWIAFLCFISAQYATIFLPLITNPLLVENNYINIPEKTILKSGKVVDNLDYINEHRIAGFQLYDPRKNVSAVQSERRNMAKIENCSKVLQTLEAIDQNNEQKFTCDEKTKTFIARGPFSLAEKSILDGLTLSIEDKKSLDALFVSTVDLQRACQKRLHSEEEMDFISRNAGELLNQTKAGWLLYHHGYSFGPMNALSLGASPYGQTMVYGWLATVTQSKVLEFFGMSNYQGYFKVYFAEYLIYFVIFLVGIWAIFRRLGTVVFAAALAISALFFLGIELIRLAPGFNPVRHVLDVPVFYLLYRYLAQDRKRHLILACALALFAILWSKDFGLFLTLSVGGAILFKGIKQRPFQLMPLFIGGITVIAGMLLYLYPMPGANPTAIYMILGVGSPQATSGKIFGLLIMVSLLLMATIRIKQNEAYTILAVGMALYFVQSLTYYIWYPSLHHILGVAPIFILWLAVLFHGWVSQDQGEGGAKRQSLVLFLLLLLVYLPASASFYLGQHAYSQTFRNHQLYNWAFEKASFISTMEPTLFEEAANLIKRYSQNDNGIFIVSKYDHILPILAGKYSAMPYNELPTNLVSPKEVEVASVAILKNKPAFLFVDSDIGRNLNGEIPIENDPATIQLQLYGEARGRVMVLQGLNNVYARVANKYVRCESGRLISVYCRNPD
ncbi:MAG: hypothetical protein WC392_05270 [Sulfuricella sp.]|jgi:hypothetical protein